MLAVIATNTDLSAGFVDGTFPWERSSLDMQRFRALTKGKCLILGQRGAGLLRNGRTEGARVLANNGRQVFVVGGSEPAWFDGDISYVPRSEFRGTMEMGVGRDAILVGGPTFLASAAQYIDRVDVTIHSRAVSAIRGGMRVPKAQVFWRAPFDQYEWVQEGDVHAQSTDHEAMIHFQMRRPHCWNWRDPTTLSVLVPEMIGRVVLREHGFGGKDGK